MSEPIKSITPVQSRVITPINEGSVYQAKSYIQFKINASELPMWLVNDSYLRFDIEYTREKYSIKASKNSSSSNKNINKTAIIIIIAVLFNIFKKWGIFYG